MTRYNPAISRDAYAIPSRSNVNILETRKD